MKNKRRDFLKLSGLAGLAIAGEGMLGGFASANEHDRSNLKSFTGPDKLHKAHISINEQIKLDLERAKSILKPSQKQLTGRAEPVGKHFGLLMISRKSPKWCKVCPGPTGLCSQ